MRFRTVSFVLGVLVGVGLAFAGAHILFGGAGPGGTASVEAASPAPGAAEFGSEPATEVTRNSPPAMLESDRREARVDPAVPTPLVVEADSVQQLLASHPADTPELEQGQGAISGTVVREDGSALAGVVLEARKAQYGSSSPQEVGQEAPALQSLEQVVNDAVEGHCRTRSSLYRVVSDAAGQFRFDRLPEGTWHLRAYGQGFTFRSLDGVPHDVPLGRRVDFEAIAVMTVPVQVVSEQGEPATAANLVVDSPDGPERRYEWTPAFPYLRLGVGEYRVHAGANPLSGSSNRLYALESQSVELQLSEGREPAALVLQLGPRAGIHGQVSFPNEGIRGGSTQVMLLELGEQQELDLSLLAQSKHVTRPRNGSFSFLDLEPGRYAVGVASGWGAQVRAHRVVAVEEGITDVSIEVPELDRSQLIAVTATDPEGLRLTGLQFRWMHRLGTKGASSSRQLRALRDRERRHLLSLQPEVAQIYFSNRAEGHEFHLAVSHDRYGEETVPLNAGQLEVSVCFAEPAGLTVHVAGYVESDCLGRASLSLTPSDSTRGLGWKREPLPPSGTLEFEALAPGSYRLALFVRGRDELASFSMGHEVLSQPVEVGNGPGQVSLHLPLLYELLVHHPEASAGARLIVSREEREWGGLQAVFDDQGRAQLGDLPAGRYRLHCTDPNSQMEVDVPCGQVEFETGG